MNSRKVMPRVWLFGASWWMFIKLFVTVWNRSCRFVCLFVCFFYSRDWNSESPVQWQGLVYIWQAGIGTSTQSHVVSNHNKISDGEISSKVCILIWLNRCIENEKFGRNSFSQTLVLTCSRVSLLINRKFTGKSNVYHNLLILQGTSNES